jgi:4-carboxymuconolactone decarboxylase
MRGLSTGHHVDERLYREAEKAFGAQGVLEITVLTGSFQTTCAILNVFDIPVPQSR